MKIQRLALWRAICTGTLIASVAAAQAPAGSGRPTHVPGGAHDHEHGRGHAEHGAGPGGKPDKGKPGADKGKGKPGVDTDEPGLPAGDSTPEGKKSGRSVGQRGMRGLLDELKTGKLKKEDVKARLSKLQEDRAERQKEHREQLKQRWGTSLSAPSAREELEHHARRSARLERALVLVETEVTKDRDKLRTRIQKLIDKEDARHERAMERLKTAPGTPAASGSAAMPAASADKAGAK